MNRFLSIDNTNPTQTALKNQEPEPKRSLFNLSRVIEQNIEIGRIHVIDCIETLPNDTFNVMNYIISLQSRNPTLKRALTGMRVYVHAHYARLWDIWEGAQNYIDTGNTGKITLQQPTLETLVDIGNNEQLNLATPMSLIDDIGAPALAFSKNRDRIKAGFGALNEDTNSLVTAEIRDYGDDKILACPFALYQMIYLTRYANRNLLQGNLNWVPENQMKFRLPYEAETVAKLSYDEPSGYVEEDLEDAIINENGDKYIDPNGKLIVPQDEKTNVYLAMPRYRLKKGDYFTTGLPFAQLIRGDIPTIDLSHIVSNIDWSEAIHIPTENIENTQTTLLGLDVIRKKIQANNQYETFGTNQGATTTWNTANGAQGNQMVGREIWKSTQETLLETMNKAKVNVTIQSKIDLATLNALEAMTIFRQRMALTNGRYNEMIEAQYGYNPKAPVNDPLYIGGFYFDINGQDIVQSSESNITPLGTKVGRLDSGDKGGIGQFHAKDFGYIMVTMSILPDTYYNGGLERWLTRKRQDEVYFPIFNNLAPQAILNKELFYSGDENNDDDIYAWTERYSDYKSRQNRVKGLMQVEELEDSSYTMQNWWKETPALNNRFLTQSQENTDMGIFTTTTEPPFVATIGQNVEVVRAMPYVTMPAGLRGGTQ